MASSYARIQARVDQAPNDALPSRAALDGAAASLPDSLPDAGLGEEAVEQHLLEDLVPGFNGPKTSANYYGFVTGGVLPAAEFADHLVTAFDQNVQVHLPDQSISTVVEDRALRALVQLLDLGEEWRGRTFTTGATGANILGLACGREAVILKRLASGEPAVGELGLLTACARAGVAEIQVLTAMGHSSLYKAASVVGLGRAAVKDVGSGPGQPWKIDVDLLQRELERDGVASIVALSAGEVNTGRFSTGGRSEMQRIRDLCDKHKAWLHVDGAFGMFARCLPRTPEFADLSEVVSGLELADSITGDGHKMLNVNPNAAYLSSGPSSIPSPLNIGLENSRRFRALPVYAVLLAYGRDGLANMFARQVRLARGIAKFLDESADYILLGQEPYATSTPAGETIDGNLEPAADADKFSNTHIVVLFRAKEDALNADLVKRINGTRQIYVSGTKWDGKAACRIAVSTWKVDVVRDIKLVTDVLQQVLKSGS